MLKKIDTVEVDFATILQARFLLDGTSLANSIDEWIESKVSSDKSKLLKKLNSSFEKYSHHANKNKIINFQIDNLDRNFIFLFLLSTNQLDRGFKLLSDRSIKIFSKDSFVDAGYLEFTSKNISYYDTVPEKISSNEVLLQCKPFYKADYLRELSLFKTAIQNIQIEINSYPTFLLTTNFGVDPKAKYYAYLIDPISKRESLFNNFNITDISPTELSLTPKNAEAVLQLSAARENGNWLVIRHYSENKFFLFKIPELTETNCLHKLWSNRQISTTPFFKYQSRINYRDADSVSFDIDLSIECSKLFNWFLPNNLRDIVRCSDILTH
jgi:hypothetical protein